MPNRNSQKRKYNSRNLNKKNKKVSNKCNIKITKTRKVKRGGRFFAHSFQKIIKNFTIGKKSFNENEVAILADNFFELYGKLKSKFGQYSQIHPVQEAMSMAYFTEANTAFQALDDKKESDKRKLIDIYQKNISNLQLALNYINEYEKNGSASFPFIQEIDLPEDINISEE